MSSISVLNLIGRKKELFLKDLNNFKDELSRIVSDSRFLVVGGAGSIGQAVTREIFKRSPKKLHVIDLSENNLVELVRDIRSSFGYISGDFKTFCLDIGSSEYDAFIEADGEYDYVLNLSALKHVRSERDPFTLMRMINVNILNTEKTLLQSISSGVHKYFCVSTDKAANPVNMMGASKKIMEMFLMWRSVDIKISTARFANVAFSDGSLLYGFNQRIQKRQPIVAPRDIKRYFLTPSESGELCLMSCIFGENRDVFFPKLSQELHLISFSEVATRYLAQLGYRPYECSSEDEARSLINTLPSDGLWPCLFTNTDTTGEKDFEEFFTQDENLDMARFNNIGVIKNEPIFDELLLKEFVAFINQSTLNKTWCKDDIVAQFYKLVPEFSHIETGRYLDGKM